MRGVREELWTTWDLIWILMGGWDLGRELEETRASREGWRWAKVWDQKERMAIMKQQGG